MRPERIVEENAVGNALVQRIIKRNGAVEWVGFAAKPEGVGTPVLEGFAVQIRATGFVAQAVENLLAVAFFGNFQFAPALHDGSPGCKSGFVFTKHPVVEVVKPNPQAGFGHHDLERATDQHVFVGTFGKGGGHFVAFESGVERVGKIRQEKPIRAVAEPDNTAGAHLHAQGNLVSADEFVSAIAPSNGFYLIGGYHFVHVFVPVADIRLAEGYFARFRRLWGHRNDGIRFYGFFLFHSGKNRVLFGDTAIIGTKFISASHFKRTRLGWPTFWNLL
jgi:hypothetical protein